MGEFNYPAAAPAIFGVAGERVEDWENLIRSIANKNVQMLVCILPGPKGKAPLYQPIKRLLTESEPIPSQVVLSSTIRKGKGLRSICNKVLLQMCAKVGGSPWVVDVMPYQDAPTMIVGIDVFHKIGFGSCLGFCASMDKEFSNFISIDQF